jgi:hypothetical protein
MDYHEDQTTGNNVAEAFAVYIEQLANVTGIDCSQDLEIRNLAFCEFKNTGKDMAQTSNGVKLLREGKERQELSLSLRSLGDGESAVPDSDPVHTVLVADVSLPSTLALTTKQNLQQ